MENLRSQSRSSRLETLIKLSAFPRLIFDPAENILSNLSENEVSRNENIFNWGRVNFVFSPEVRSLCVRLMDVKQGDIVWEIGAGTGSVSLASALKTPEANYYAIEMNPERYDLLRENIVRFRASHVQAYHGRAPEVFSHLPPPDVVFIGGSNGHIKSILDGLKSYFERGCTLVGSFIDDKNVETVRTWLSGKPVRDEWMRFSKNRDDFVGNRDSVVDLLKLKLFGN